MNDLAIADDSWGPSSHTLPVVDLLAMMRSRAAGQTVCRAEERRLRDAVAAELDAAGITSLRGDGWTVTAKAAALTAVGQDEYVVTAMATVAVKLATRRHSRRQALRASIQAALVPQVASSVAWKALAPQP